MVCESNAILLLFCCFVLEETLTYSLGLVTVRKINVQRTVTALHACWLGHIFLLENGGYDSQPLLSCATDLYDWLGHPIHVVD
jgi:hypothetical protein